MPLVTIAKRENGKIISQGIVSGKPNEDAIRAAATWFMYLSKKYGINSIKLETENEVNE